MATATLADIDTSAPVEDKLPPRSTATTVSFADATRGMTDPKPIVENPRLTALKDTVTDIGRKAVGAVERTAKGIGKEAAAGPKEWVKVLGPTEAGLAAAKSDIKTALAPNYQDEKGQFHGPGLSAPLYAAQSLWDVFAAFTVDPIAAALQYGYNDPVKTAYSRALNAAGATPKHVEVINDWLDGVLNTAEGFAFGPEGATKLGEPKFGPPPKPGFQPATGESPGLPMQTITPKGKITPKAATMKFRELAATQPEAAEVFADATKTIAPKVGEQLHKELKTAAEMSSKEKVILGKDAAQQQMGVATPLMDTSLPSSLDKPGDLPGTFLNLYGHNVQSLEMAKDLIESPSFEVMAGDEHIGHYSKIEKLGLQPEDLTYYANSSLNHYWDNNPPAEIGLTQHVSQISDYVKDHTPKENKTYLQPHVDRVKDTPEFQRWATTGGEVLKEANGDPKVMYRGASHDIHVLEPRPLGNYGSSQSAIFTSPSTEVASSFAGGNYRGSGGNVLPVFVKAKNAFDYQNRKHVADLARIMKKEIKATRGLIDVLPGIINDIVRGSWSTLEEPEVQKAIRLAGHDGFYTNEGGAKNLAVFDSKQVKSAIGNRGTFDPDDPELVATQLGHPDSLWGNINDKVKGVIRSGTSGPASMFLDRLLKAVPKERISGRSDYQHELLTRLKEKVGDVPVEFKEKIDWVNPKTKVRELLGGVYWAEDHKIEIALNGRGTQDLVHELYHAGTFKFIEENPNHPLVKEIKQLHEVAKGRFATSAFAQESAVQPYGLTTVHEFVSEAMSNKEFQQWLMKSEVHAAPGEKLGATLWDKFASIVKRIFNVSDKAFPLLERTLATSNKLLDAGTEARQPRAPPSMISAGLRETSRQLNTAISEDKEVKGNPPMGAFRRLGSAIPGFDVIAGKMSEYAKEITKHLNPSALGRGGEVAASMVMRGRAEAAYRLAQLGRDSAMREAFWHKNMDKVWSFIQGHELGVKWKDPTMQAASDGYRKWMKDIYDQDMRTGFKYDPIDHYMMHAFENPVELEAWLTKQFGSKWKDPSFIKDRGFDLYAQAMKAKNPDGTPKFKPKFKTPEQIAMARQTASDIAEMQVNLLQDLERTGLAIKVTEGSYPKAGFETVRRAPTGDRYYIQKDSAQLLHNAFDTVSLWSARGKIPFGGLVQDVFRGLMAIKNTIIPIRLASLFHVLHEGLGLDNATAFQRAAKELISGATNPLSAFGKMLGSLVPLKGSFYDNPKLGGRLIRAYQGRIKPGELTTEDKQMMLFMNEGGFVPFMDRAWTNNAVKNFKTALGDRSLKAIPYAPLAAIQALQIPVFEYWIPRLKTAAYAREVATALKVDPSLLNDPLKRQLALTKLTKNVDQRFGEMSYGNLFWPRWFKDLAVLNTLSVGWQLGVVGQFGGAAVDVARVPFKGSLAKQAATGRLDRPLFVAGYTGMAMMYSGALSYALSGVFPSGQDWINPRNGEKNDDGTPKRLNTMFFTREFYSIYKHLQNVGVVDTVKDIASSKASGLIGLAQEAATGVSKFDKKEFRNPDGTLQDKVGQTIKYLLHEHVEPIAATQPAPTKQQAVLNTAGFTVAPKYVTDTKTTSAIKEIYDTYYAAKQTPYEKAVISADSKAVRELIRKDDPKADEALGKLQEKYDMSGADIKRLIRTAVRGDTPEMVMFSHFTWQQQKKLLDKMTPEEREVYLPHSNKQHLRYSYEAPK